MTIEHDTSGTGAETYRSSRFTATVNGTTNFVYGWERAAGFTTTIWEYLDDVEISWLKFGADQSVTVAIELADATPITSAVVYPKNVATDQSIVDGVLTLTVPTNTDLYIEVNGERAEPLLLFAQPLKTALPGAYDAFYSDLGKPIQSIDAGTDTLTFGSAHGLTTGQQIVLNLRPTGGSFPAPLAEGEVYSVVVTGSNTCTLLNSIGDAVNITQDAAAVLYANVWGHTDTVNALYFGPGRYAIGWNFPLAANTTVYLDRGAVVCGGFKVRDVATVSIKGPGQFSGELATFEEVYPLAFQDKREYCIFNGSLDADNYSDNTVQGVTVFATPFWASNNGVWSYRNVQIISPWTSNTDGFLPTRRNSSTYASEVVDCFSFVGDDNIHIENRGPIVRTVSGCFLINTAAACLHAGYEPEGTSNAAYSNTVTDCDLMHLQQSTGDGAVIRAWMDGWADAADNGVWNCDISDVRVWGPLGRPLISLRNYSATWDSDVRLLYGQIAEWTLDGIAVEEEPTTLSILEGKDADNCPHDITFTDLTIAGTLVHVENYTDYFDVDEFCYALSWDDVPETPSETVVVVEDGTGLATANSYCTRTEADVFHRDRNGNPATWSGATDAAKDAALIEAAFALDTIYGQRWIGRRYSSEQGLDWPRTGAYDTAGNSLDDTIPTKLKHAQALLAYEVVAGNDVLQKTETSAAIASESKAVGPISKTTTYIGGKPTSTQYPAVRRVLMSAGLITGGGVGWGYASL